MSPTTFYAFTCHGDPLGTVDARSERDAVSMARLLWSRRAVLLPAGVARWGEKQAAIAVQARADRSEP